MKILALEKEAAQTQASDFQPYLAEEAAKVYELYQTGVIRELYFHQTDHTAVLMLECANVDEARRVLGSLPLVKAGLITFDMLPLVPYPGFARLFKQG
jgi:muconolactone delta-isomerase